MNKKENTYLKLAVASLSFLALWNVIVGIYFLWGYLRAIQTEAIKLGPNWSKLANELKIVGIQATVVGIIMLLVTYFLFRKKKIAWWLSFLSIFLLILNDFIKTLDLDIFLILEALVLLVASLSLINSRNLFQ